MDKVCAARDAVATISSGMTLGVGGWGARRKPMALIREILRSDIKDLTVISYGGTDVGMLCAAGKVRKLVFAFVSLDFIPLEPYFRKARQQGDIEVMELDEGLIMLGLKAAAIGAPFIPTAAGLGTDVITKNTEIKLVPSPYDGDKAWVAMPALRPDVSLVHVSRADRRGVCEIAGPDHYMDDLFVRAAERAIVSCDELVDTQYFHDDGRRARSVFWERSRTSALVHAPLGAHPTSNNPLYGYDAEHLKHYAASAKAEAGWDGYYQEFIAGGEDAYLRQIGGEAKVKALPLPAY